MIIIGDTFLQRNQDKMEAITSELQLSFSESTPSYSISKNDITSSIYRTRSYMKWRYGGVRHGTIGGNSRDIAFGVLALG